MYNELLISIFQTINDFIRIPDTFQTDIITSVIALFVVIDPIGNIPLFIAFTKKLEKAEHKTVSKTAILTAAALLLLFGMAGTQILQLFGITIFSFMIAGGTLLFIIAIELLTYGEWRFAGGVKEEVGVVPIAFPLLAGPGSITAVIISYQTSGFLITFSSIIIVMAITYVILRMVNPIYKVLGNRGSMIVSRVFAVIIAAIAVEYIVKGIKNLFLI
ncbi:MAG: MarC family protein [Nitrososphaeraceae archaeon]|jgi:multiple antibiotic resistance protein|nr:MarC family protein [Nitrososphaeraceae archaeon]MDW3626736.1 MarC family protein [Nitrososphaeraceae archaeon]